MRSLMPFFEHRRDAVFPGSSPRAVVVPPARTPEQEPKRPECREEEEEQDQEAEETKAKPEGAMERHSPAVIGIRHRGGLTRGSFDSDRRALCYTCLEGKVCDPSDRG